MVIQLALIVTILHQSLLSVLTMKLMVWNLTNLAAATVAVTRDQRGGNVTNYVLKCTIGTSFTIRTMKLLQL